MKKVITILILFSSILTYSQKSQKKNAGNYAYEVECMGIEMDGSVTVKAFGKGRNRADAVEQAKKEAINTILFKGLKNGRSECGIVPLLNEPNIREKKEEYFNLFFKDNGEYQKYVSNADESLFKKEKLKARDGDVVFGFIIRVQKSELKSKLITDNILIKKN